jgi:hypothetical protein
MATATCRRKEYNSHMHGHGQLGILQLPPRAYIRSVQYVNVTLSMVIGGTVRPLLIS